MRAKARGALQRLWSMFPDLRAVVLMGRKAQGAQQSIEAATELTVFLTFHSSNQAHQHHDTIKLDLAKVAQFLRESAPAKT